MLARFFYKCRYAFAVFTAVSAAALVWLWPQQPLWRSPANVGRLNCFSPDGAVVVTTFAPPHEKQIYPDPVISRWDAVTGDPLSRVVLNCSEPLIPKRTFPAQNGLLAIVEKTILETIHERERRKCLLYDATTGLRCPLSIPDEDLMLPLLSPNGRWFHGRHYGQSEKGPDIFAKIYSVSTGELVLTCRREGYSPVVLSFASDDSIAVISEWEMVRSMKEMKCTVLVVELPSGKELYRVDLPQGMGVLDGRWETPWLRTTLMNAAGEGEVRSESSLTFNTSQNPIGPGIADPMLVAEYSVGETREYFQDGLESVAYFKTHKQSASPPWYQGAQQWLVKNLAIAAPAANNPNIETYVNVRVVNRQTKATTYESLQPLRIPCLVSPSGRLLACATDDNGIAVWDTNPGPRWPWSLAAGFGVLAVFWLLGRFNQRRLRRRKLAQHFQMPSPT